jgi:hypothetical protein
VRYNIRQLKVNSGVRLELEDVLNLKYSGIYLNALVAVIHSVVRIADFI